MPDLNLRVSRSRIAVQQFASIVDTIALGTWRSLDVARRALAGSDREITRTDVRRIRD